MSIITTKAEADHLSQEIDQHEIVLKRAVKAEEDSTTSTVEGTQESSECTENARRSGEEVDAAQEGRGAMVRSTILVI